MKRVNFFIVTTVVFLMVACQSQSAVAPTSLPAPVEAPPQIPTEIPLPTATLSPTETSLPEPTALPTETLIPTAESDPDLFGFIKIEDAQMGFMLDPIVGQIFEIELQKRVASGEIEAFQVESLGLYPRADGTFYAEVFYRVKTENLFWPEDFGTLSDDGWTTGKCTRFNFESTDKAFYLKNKKICS